ncbi:alpha/beta hydrolase [uncultured Microbacterium sp.]|uniref:alpha/beta hydrolase n=1 Tax=uncultured Microbacterium sp. TaxID=191216 RepID=UPI00261CF238|nr:alpha/beta hydrolase [uncultured Microbacterium sp.]
MVAIVGASLVGLVVLLVAGVLVYSQVGVLPAEAAAVASVRENPAITLRDEGSAIVMTPASEASGNGLVFIPGAKVDPWAYAPTLAGLVADDHMTVVITKPWLNLALFDLRGLSTFTDLASGVETWLVGGHSLGGVRACQLAPDASGLVLFGSYCATDLSHADLPALSLAGSEDGLSTPAKIAESRHNLPADAELVEIPGASHASFGAYGVQPGDGTPTLSDADVDAIITDRVGAFAQALTR